MELRQDEREPGDHASRGLTPKQVVQNQLWWKGPPWLAKPPYEWPTNREPLGELPELRIRKLILLELPVWTKYSSMKKRTRVLAYWYRLIDYKKRKRIKKALPPALSSDKMKRAKFKVIQHIQHAPWSEDIKQLENKQQVQVSSSIAQFNPFLDDDGLLRIGGRLEESNLPSSIKHPILLLKSSSLLKTFLEDFHREQHHPRPSAIEALLYQNYYPVGSRQLVKSVCKCCVICRKALAKTRTQLMGNLPEVRTAPARPFECLQCEKRAHQEACIHEILCLSVCLHVHTCHTLRQYRRPLYRNIHPRLRKIHQSKRHSGPHLQ